MTVFMAILIALIVFCIYLYVRNEKVYAYRMALLQRVNDASQLDPVNDWRWRYDELDAVSYNQMMIRFWKRFDSFYAQAPDRTFK